MPRLVSRPRPRSAGALPGLRGSVAGTEERPEEPRLSGSSEIRPTNTRDAGVRALLEQARETGEGARLLIYGRTRYGKTSLTGALVQALLADRIAGTVLVHDPKFANHAQYAGPTVTSLATLGPAAKAEPVVVLRPPLTGAEGALAARALTEAGEPTALVVDELRRVLGGSQKWSDADGPDGPGRGARNLEWLCLEGGGHGASLICLVQRPRQVPGDAVDSAQAIAVMGLGGRSLAYLVDAGAVPRDAADTIRRLPRGAFCVFSDDQDWDRRVYYSPL